MFFFFSSRRRHTRCALVTGVQTCALPITGFLEVLDAERSLYAAEDALIQSRIAITTNYIALNKALGGGWDGAIASSQPEIIDVNTGPHFVSSSLGSAVMTDIYTNTNPRPRLTRSPIMATRLTPVA